MAMEINRNYSSYGMQVMGESSTVNNTKKKEKSVKKQESVSREAENQTITNQKSGSSQSTADYAKKLEKLVPSVEFKVGYAFSSAPKGKTLTVNPKLLEKMQNDPEKEKEMKELIKGVETMTRLMSSINAASGWTVVYKHCYIDENGKFSSIAYLRNDFMLNMSDELREERRENEEKLIEKTKEKAAEKKEELEEMLEEKEKAEGISKEKGEEAEGMPEEKGEEVEEISGKKGEVMGEMPEEKEEIKAMTEKKSGIDEVKQLLSGKVSESEDGTIYLDHEDMLTILKAVKDGSGDNKADKKEKPVIGGNLDLQV